MKTGGFLHAQHFDILIRNGQILDGSGNPAFQGDVGIRDDRIVAIGRLPRATADRVIDATGLHVAPGFDKGVITLPFAVRSNSSLPAHIVGLRDRGSLQEGFVADVVVFDYERLDDRYDLLQPDLGPVG